MGKKKSQNCSKCQKNAEKCRFFQPCTGCDSCVNRGPDVWNTQVILSNIRAWDLKLSEKKSQFFHGLLKKHCPLHPKKCQNFPTFLRKPGSSWLLTLYSIFPIYLKRSPKNYQKVRVYALAMELKVSRNASRTKRIQHRHQAWNNLGMRSCARSWHKIRKRLRVRAHSKRVFLLYTAVP